tara:strand:+ start:172037 stop:173374 length:1338 start_codon:yes stop_codon:yes gene_type:complete
LVPDGIGIKNYLYARLFRESNTRITLFHNFDQDTLDTIAKNIPFQNEVPIPIYRESFREKLLRELIHLSRLKFNAKKEKNPTILKFWNKSPKKITLKLFYKLVTLAALFVNRYKTILWLEKQYAFSLSSNSFYKEVKGILEKHKPDQIFCTHQRALKAPTIFAAAQSLNIKTSTVIYSWDNLPKARLALRGDKYFVWSEHMRQEILNFYPEIPEEQIKITGTPQFEFYYDAKNIIQKKEFYNRYHLDENKKLICFSGDDIRTSPYDPEYLDHIASAIKENGINAQILFRRCPVDLSGRFDWVTQKHPHLIREAAPLWNFNSKKWTAVYPTKDDIRLLVSTAYYSDMVINVGSTMAFDFGMFNKPCLFINYDVKEAKNWSVNTIYKYQHFRSMPSKKAVYWLDSQASISKTILEALNHPKTDISEWFKVVVNYPESASENILKELM